MICRILVALGLFVAAFGIYGAAKAEEPKWTMPLTLAYDESNEPIWLARVLKKLETKKRWRVREYRLFRQAGRPTFLALVWTAAGRPDIYWNVLELYKVDVISDGNVRLNFVRGDRQPFLSIRDISGRDIAGDGVPHLVLHYGSGGMWFVLYGVRIYRLVSNSVDVTPSWAGRADKFVELNSGEDIALSVANDRWVGFFSGCSGCGPSFATLMTWTTKGFAPVCRDHPTYYEQFISHYQKVPAAERDGRLLSLRSRLWLGMGAAFNQVQAGHFDAAQATYAKALADAKSRSAESWGETPEEYTHWIEAVERAFGPALQAATTAGRDYACPLMAYGGKGGHIGLRRRAESFRSGATTRAR